MPEQSSKFVSIRDGQSYSGAIPAEVQLPESEIVSYRGEEAIKTALVTYRQGDPGWDAALVRWMWLQGYASEADVQKSVDLEESLPLRVVLVSDREDV